MRTGWAAFGPKWKFVGANITKQEVVDAATSRPVVAVDFETSRLFWKVTTIARVNRPFWKDERNMLAPIEKAAPTSIAGAALFCFTPRQTRQRRMDWRPPCWTRFEQAATDTSFYYRTTTR
jgi:hypothetical protein